MLIGVTDFKYIQDRDKCGSYMEVEVIPRLGEDLWSDMSIINRIIWYPSKEFLEHQAKHGFLPSAENRRVVAILYVGPPI